jgi:hypothetical protein
MYIIKSIHHDGGVYDYVGEDLLSLTNVYEKAFLFEDGKEAEKFRLNMQDANDFLVFSRLC